MTATAEPAVVTPRSQASPQADPARALRVMVDRFGDVPSAERALERLREAGVPEHAMWLTATGVRTGKAARRERYGDAVKAGTGQGAVFGALLGILWTAAGYADEPMVLVGALLGAVAGALMGALVHWYEMRSDFSGIVEASSFDLLVDEAHARRAEEILSAEPAR